MERIIAIATTSKPVVAACIVPSSLVVFTLLMGENLSPETSLLTRATLRNIPEDGILHSHRRKTSNLTLSCMKFVFSAFIDEALTARGSSSLPPSPAPRQPPVSPHNLAALIEFSVMNVKPI
jgi:hypothetical protein